MAGLVMNTHDSDLSLIEVTTKELEIKGIWLNPNTFGNAIQLVAEKKNILNKLKTEVFKLNDIAAAFERALSKDINRILVKP